MKISRDNIVLMTECLILLVLSCGMSSCGGAVLSPSKDKYGVSEDIYISGAYPLYPLVEKWGEEFCKKYPNVNFHLSAGGAGKGMSDIMSDVVDLAMISREIEEEETKMGAIAFAVSKDAVVPTFNSNNPFFAKLMYKGISKEMCKRLWINGESISWGELLGTEDTVKINLLTRSDACGAGAVWAKYLGGFQEDLKGKMIYSDPGLAQAVINDSMSLGINNTGYVFDLETGRPHNGISVLPIDINDNGKIDDNEYFYDRKMDIVIAIENGTYPAQLVRDLCLVSKGTPTREIVREFLKYVLSSEAQGIAERNYYISMSRSVLDDGLHKLSGNIPIDTSQVTK